jgi:hypothetical protein
MYSLKNNAISLLMLLTALLLTTSLYNREVQAEDCIPNDSNLKYARANINLEDIKNEEHSELESPLRRFEITFIISLPFVFLVNFLALHIADVIILKDPDVNVWNNHGPFLILNTLVFTSIVSFHEASIVGDAQKREQALGSERRTYLVYTKRY